MFATLWSLAKDQELNGFKVANPLWTRGIFLFGIVKPSDAEKAM
jgi:hypothetical protein